MSNYIKFRRLSFCYDLLTGLALIGMLSSVIFMLATYSTDLYKLESAIVFILSSILFVIGLKRSEKYTRKIDDIEYERRKIYAKRLNS
tara:strand:+ start:101 stop:364 length:264 start_codon:yes stop_codon:yes gene_type:complete